MQYSMCFIIIYKVLFDQGTGTKVLNIYFDRFTDFNLTNPVILKCFMNGILLPNLNVGWFYKRYDGTIFPIPNKVPRAYEIEDGLYEASVRLIYLNRPLLVGQTLQLGVNVSSGQNVVASVMANFTVSFRVDIDIYIDATPLSAFEENWIINLTCVGRNESIFEGFNIVHIRDGRTIHCAFIQRGTDHRCPALRAYILSTEWFEVTDGRMAVQFKFLSKDKLNGTLWRCAHLSSPALGSPFLKVYFLEPVKTLEESSPGETTLHSMITTSSRVKDLTTLLGDYQSTSHGLEPLTYEDISRTDAHDEVSGHAGNFNGSSNNFENVTVTASRTINKSFYIWLPVAVGVVGIVTVSAYVAQCIFRHLRKAKSATQAIMHDRSTDDDGYLVPAEVTDKDGTDLPNDGGYLRPGEATNMDGTALMSLAEHPFFGRKKKSKNLDDFLNEVRVFYKKRDSDGLSSEVVYEEIRSRTENDE